jgi:hypothetical protein
LALAKLASTLTLRIYKLEVSSAENLSPGEILKQAGMIDDFQLNSALSYQRH